MHVRSARGSLCSKRGRSPSSALGQSSTPTRYALRHGVRAIDRYDYHGPRRRRALTKRQSMDHPVKQAREQRGMSQVDLAESAKLTRQSIGPIEAGRATPSVEVALRLAKVLERSVEELFDHAQAADAVVAEVARPFVPGRLALAHIAGRWVAHSLQRDGLRVAADAVAAGKGANKVQAELLRAASEARDNTLVAGCAAALGLLTDRVSAQRGAGRFLTLSCSSTAALEALARRRRSFGRRQEPRRERLRRAAHHPQNCARAVDFGRVGRWAWWSRPTRSSAFVGPRISRAEAYAWLSVKRALGRGGSWICSCVPTASAGQRAAQRARDERPPGSRSGGRDRRSGHGHRHARCRHQLRPPVCSAQRGALRPRAARRR